MQGITLIIPTYNRHHYLDRSLDYYSATSMRILVADSTNLPYTPKINNELLTYLHLPGVPLTKKIPYVLSLVETPFVVMCADDDFTIPDAIKQCMDFLIENEDYTSSLGNCICYLKNTLYSGKVQFAAMYTDRLSYQFDAVDPFERLKHFFEVYRTIFYGVHRTDVIKQAFLGADQVITNLFLNEYTSSILPVIKGKIAGLPLLMQVREFAENSDDKNTLNLDAVFTNQQYAAEYAAFLHFQSARIAELTGKDESFCRDKLDRIMMDHARYLIAEKMKVRKPLIKQIGSIIELVPLAGKKIIRFYRAFEQEQKLALFIRSETDRLNLVKIRSFINQYKNAVRT